MSYWQVQVTVEQFISRACSLFEHQRPGQFVVAYVFDKLITDNNLPEDLHTFNDILWDVNPC